MTLPEIESWHRRALGEAAAAALGKNGFDALYCETREEAVERAMAFVAPGATVGFGGSMTVRELGIKERAQALGAVLLDHGEPGLSPERKAETMRLEQTCDVFLSGSNAVTLDGALVNVDGNGNRVNAMAFGPKKAVIIAGINKIVADEEAGYRRIREYAAPMNCKRLGIPNPCTVGGVCRDCAGPTRICRVYSTLRRKPSYSDLTVILVGESLGF